LEKTLERLNEISGHWISHRKTVSRAKPRRKISDWLVSGPRRQLQARRLPCEPRDSSRGFLMRPHSCRGQDLRLMHGRKKNEITWPAFRKFSNIKLSGTRRAARQNLESL
jgi:hypothetical protein